MEEAGRYRETRFAIFLLLIEMGFTYPFHLCQYDSRKAPIFVQE